MEVRVLGPIEVVADSVLSVGGKTQRRILAMLAAHSNAIVSVDRLADATWNDDEMPDRAAHNIRTYVHRIRSALGDYGDRLETVDGGYRLTLEPDEIDQATFEALAEQTRRRRRVGALGDVVATTDRAMTLWRGEPYGEFVDEAWVVPIVAHLYEVRLGLLARRADSLIGLGSAEDALGDVATLCEENPFNERPHMLHVRALASAGRRTDALRAFQHFRARLIDQVGVEPSAEFYELDRSIAEGSSGAEAPSPYAGAYDLHECVGVGVSAFVHRATQRSVGREVALKIIRPELANDPDFIRRFETEARTVARVNHPNVVPLYDFWRDADRAYLVMRHMEGGSLADRLMDGPLTIEGTVELIDAVAQALDAAHAIGVIHCDIKPANVLFDGEGRAFLADFGIALDLFGGIEQREALEQTITSLSPEQIRNEPLGRATDVHGLGVLAYTALTGSSPFAGPTPADMQRQILEAALPSVAELRSDVPPAVDDVLATATAKKPNGRHASATDFAHALQEALNQPVGVAAVAPRNPYRGLEAFDEPDAEVFHGREELVDAMVSHLAGAGLPALVLVGPSGSGKSSVVRAGLLPAIRRGAIQGSAQWFTTTLTPGSKPFEAIELSLLRVAIDPPPTLLQMLKRGERGLLQAVRRCLPADDSTLVMVIDQFEELFTNASPAEAEAVMDALVTAVSEPKSPLRLVATLRADFYDRPLAHAGFAELLGAGTVPIAPMQPGQLARAIVEPARLVGADVDDGVVAEVIADVAGEPSSLPLLQFALTRAFDHGISTRLTVDDYRAVGGVRGAIGTYADGVYSAMGDDEQMAVRGVLGRLVVLSEGSPVTACRALRSELASNPIDERVIDQLGAARLVAFDNDPFTREPTVELAHEALAREWPRLRMWLDEDRADLRSLRRLRQATDEWQAGGEREEDLYRGTRLDGAAQLMGERPHDLTDAERQFVGGALAFRQRAKEKTQAQLDSQVQTNRNLRRLVAGVGVLLVLAMLSAGLALRERSRVDSARRDAVDAQVLAETARQDSDAARVEAVAAQQLSEDRRQEAEAASAAATSAEELAASRAFDAETARLVAISGTLVETDPRVAMLLARSAWDREESPETLGALQIALTRAGSFVRNIGWGTAYIDVEVVDGDRVVGLRGDGVDLFDLDTGELLDTFALDTSATYVFASSMLMASAKRAPRVAIVDDSKTLRVFDAEDTLDVVLEIVGEKELTGVSLSPTGDVVAITDIEHRVTSWEVGGSELFSTDLDDNVFIYDHVRPVFGDTFPFWEHYTTIPFESGVHLLEEEVLVSAGAALHRFTYTGEPIGARSFFATTVGFPAFAVNIVDAGDSVVLVGQAELVEMPLDEGWPGVIVGDPLASSSGGGSPNIHGATRSADGTAVLVLQDGTVIRWQDGDEQVSRGLAEVSGVTASARSTDDRLVISHGQGLTVTSIARAGPIATVVPRDDLQQSLNITSDGSALVLSPTAGGIGELHLFDLSGPLPVRRDDAPFSPDAYVGGIDENDNLWSRRLVDGAQLFEVFERTTSELIESVSNIPSSSAHAVSALLGVEALGTAGPERVLILASGTRDLIADLDAPAGTTYGALTTVTFSNDDMLLLVANAAGNHILYDTTTWTPVDVLGLAGINLAIGGWNQDATLFASASADGQITIRDGTSFEAIRELVGPTGTSNTWSGGSIAFSPDDSLLFTNFDGPARIWDLQSGRLIGREFPWSGSPRSGANGSAGQNHLVTAIEGAALVWNLDIDSWPEVACQSAGSNLTEAEWTQWGPRDQEWSAICVG